MVRDDAADDRNRWSGPLDRRSVLRALGVGSSVALTSGYGVASAQHGGGGDGDGTAGDGGGGGQGNRQCPPCIDPYSGYLQAEPVKGDRPLGPIDPVTTVELRVADADVAFPDDEAPAGVGPGPGTNETANQTGNETVPGTEVNETEGDGAVAGGEPQDMPDFYFDPVGVHLQPGDSVEFLVREELHTVTAFHPRFGFQQRVPDGVPGFTSPPFLAGDSWYYRFDEPGVYDMLCLPHFSLGMVMRAVVVDEESQEIPEAAPLPSPDDPEQGLPELERNVLGSPELEPANIVEQGSVAWTDLSDIAAEPSTGI